ncbi:hypothetical protein HYH02_014951 [Chlamydomonas schloesseri]|uniref:Uncharacterized protein n=1 Tax=Chlamydomonas schloesseri TaxID=2026947 RepID=A0A835SP57_9CHLO|nr:hypothetical protein HYH02_014951 [Chlamydomonas schloesseri]|eukprot:KAG2425734.1 hypothetical protein HYH02_014951 [Chlamydomonas schloesseri]
MALTVEPLSPNLLQTDLLTIKHTSDPALLFPSHAYGRGGVGHFLCTGHSRAGIHRLPQAASKAASLSLTARGRASSSRSRRSTTDSADGLDPNANGSSISGFSLIGSDPAAIGATRAWEAGSVAHASNFVAACRSVRPSDVPRGSKWAAVSFFENDPREVARHMQVLDFIQAKQDMAKAAERQTEQARHNIWAEQQRETFRRQRLEQAARYTRSGMRPRSAYAELGAVAAAEHAHNGYGSGSVPGYGSQEGSGGGGGGGGRMGGIAPPSADATSRYYGALGRNGTFESRDYGSGSARGGGGGSMPYYSGSKPRPSTALPAGSVYTGRGGPLTAAQAAAANHFNATLSATAEVAAAGGGGAIPLPKKTFIHVYERMAAEAAETPAARAAAVAAAQAAAEDERRQALLDGEMAELDSFEARMRSLQRTRSRVAHTERRRMSSAYMEEDSYA